MCLLGVPSPGDWPVSQGGEASISFGLVQACVALHSITRSRTMEEFDRAVIPAMCVLVDGVVLLRRDVGIGCVDSLVVQLLQHLIATSCYVLRLTHMAHKHDRPPERWRAITLLAGCGAAHGELPRRNFGTCTLWPTCAQQCMTPAVGA